MNPYSFKRNKRSFSYKNVKIVDGKGNGVVDERVGKWMERRAGGWMGE